MKTKIPLTLRDKVVVITGASSGAGRAAALEFAKQKATIVLAARNADALEEAAEECRYFGATVHVVPTDVTDAAAVQQLADKTVELCGKLDVWVNNAGVLAIGKYAQTPVEIHTQVVRTNLLGYMHGAHAALSYFMAQQEGILINNISVGGWFPVPYGAGYSASKYGITGFMQALSGELTQYKNIHVCNLFPAFLDTPGIQHAANYTGVLVKPAPPLYDPIKVAKAMVQLAHEPKPSKLVGGIAPLLKLAHFIAPSLSRLVTATVIKTYLKQAEQAPVTSGNLFAPSAFGTSIYGGWTTPVTLNINRKKVTVAAALLAGAAGLWWIARKRDEVV